MIKVTEDEKTYLKEVLTDWETLLVGDLKNLLSALHDYMMDNGYDDRFEITSIGMKAEKMFDSIYQRNT